MRIKHFVRTVAAMTVGFVAIAVPAGAQERGGVVYFLSWDAESRALVANGSAGPDVFSASIANGVPAVFLGAGSYSVQYDSTAFSECLFDEIRGLAWCFPADGGTVDVVALVGDAGDDALSVDSLEPPPVDAVVIIAGDGDDSSQNDGQVPVVVDAGPGDDRVTGTAAGDILRGGAGDDELYGGAGPDELYGDAGNDRLDGDYFSRLAGDVLDGGAGKDTVTGWVEEVPDYPRVVITLDGQPNDGRQGEGDNVVNVEEVFIGGGGRFVGDNRGGKVNALGSDGRLNAKTLGGRDQVEGGSEDDRIDGGNGPDKLMGNGGNDVITGGPGRDNIFGDYEDNDADDPFGSDTIKVRDGARDFVQCGRGLDTVIADSQDVIAEDCETVRRI